MFFISQLLQVTQGLSPLQAGLHILPWTATLFFVAPIAGQLADRFGDRPFLVIGPLLQATGMGWLGLIADHPYGEMIAPMIIAGIGISMTFPAAQSAVVSSVPEAELGKASGVNSTMRELGGVLGIAIGVAAFSSAGSYASPGVFADGFSAAMVVSASLSIIAAIAGAALPRRAALAAEPALT